MLTRKGKYGLKALICLARQEEGKRTQISDIAEQQEIPRKFLEAILNELRNAGYVHARKGPQGGYWLARAASEISIGRVIRSLDGKLAPIGCASSSRYEPCPDCDEKRCEIRSVMVEVRQAICNVLDKCSLEDLQSRRDLLALTADDCE